MQNSGISFYKGFLVEYSEIIDRNERLSEIIFGVIMTLTFTGVISVATEGMQGIRSTLWAALGCNIAWGIIDGLFYLMNTLYSRGQGLEVFKKIRTARTSDEANQTILQNITPIVARVINNEQVNHIREELIDLPEPPKRAILVVKDFYNALLIFVLVFLSTFPMALPLLFINDPYIALRLSNVIGLLIIFIAGFIIGKKTGYNKMVMGLLFALLGAIVVLMTIALGG